MKVDFLELILIFFYFNSGRTVPSTVERFRTI